MLKRKTFILTFLVIAAFSMTSCVNILEKVLFNKDGSGTYTAVVDMSKVASMIASMGGLDENNEMAESLNQMNSDFSKTAARIESQEGVSNARSDIDKEKLIISISFDFEDVDALNRGMSAYYHDEGKNGSDIQQYVFFTKGKKMITRTSENLVLDALKDALAEDDEPEVDMSVILADMYFESEITFAGQIKSVSNPEYVQGNKLNGDENTIRWRKYLFNNKDANKEVEVTVRTKK